MANLYQRKKNQIGFDATLCSYWDMEEKDGSYVGFDIDLANSKVFKLYGIDVE